MLCYAVVVATILVGIVFHIIILRGVLVKGFVPAFAVIPFFCFGEFMTTVTIKDVEVFSAGNHKNRTYSEADLTQIVNNTNSIISELKPFVKISHDSEQTLVSNSQLPSAGWVENIRKVGSKVVADFSRVPKVVADVIRAGGYRRVSSEILSQIKSTSGEIKNNVLYAVALLGADLPAVRSLTDLPKLYEDNSIETFTFDLNFEEVEMTTENNEVAEKATTEAQESATVEKKDVVETVEFAELSRENETLRTEKSELVSLVASLEQRLKVIEMQRVQDAEAHRRSKIELFVEDLKSEGRVTPSAEEKVKGLLETLVSDTEVITFSEEETSRLDLAMSAFSAITEQKLVAFTELASAKSSKDDMQNLREQMKSHGFNLKEAKQ